MELYAKVEKRVFPPPAPENAPKKAQTKTEPMQLLLTLRRLLVVILSPILQL